MYDRSDTVSCDKTAVYNTHWTPDQRNLNCDLTKIDQVNGRGRSMEAIL